MRGGIRYYGIDYLRIISMFFIVIIHIVDCGGIFNSVKLFSANYEAAWLMYIASYCAVDCYALISGFLGVNRKYRYSGIVELWLQVLFYSLVLTVVCLLLPRFSLSWREVAVAIFPVVRGQYWYFTAYFGLYFLMPVLNHVLNTFPKRKMLLSLVLAVLVFSILPTVLHGRDYYGTAGGFSTFWLSILYCIGGYIRKYDSFSKLRSGVLFAIYAASVIVTWLSKLVIEFVTSKFLGEPQMGDLFISYTSPTVLLAAVALFAALQNLRITKAPKIVMCLSQASFSVYLIHTHRLIYGRIMPDMFSSYANYSPLVMVLAVLVTAVVIYTACTLIDLLRQKLFWGIHVKEKLILFEKKCKNKYLTSYTTNSTNRT